MTRRIKFVWGSSQVIRGRWFLGLFGFYDRRDGCREDGLAISLRGLALWLGAAAAAGYLGCATALFWFWQRDPYSLRTFSDAAFYPLRRGVIRDKNGLALLARGTDALREKKWADALTLLRQGLALHPNNWRARLMLAQIYVATNQRTLAMRLMQEGLTGEYPGRSCLAAIFAMAEQGGDFNTVVQTARRYLPLLAHDKAGPDRRWLQAREVAALLAAGRIADAQARVESAPPGDVSVEQRVLVLLEAKHSAEALRVLADAPRSSEAERAVVARLSVRALREAGRFEEMERAVRAMHALAPAEPSPLVYAVVQQALAGREEAARAALDDYLFRFGGSPDNLTLLAAPLAEIGHTGLLERCAAAAAERGYLPAPFATLRVEAHVHRGEWPAARRLLADLTPASGGAAAPRQAWCGWMERLLDAAEGRGSASPLALVDFLRSRPWPVKVFQSTVATLRRADQVEAARDVLGLARATFPASAWAEAQAAEVARVIAARAPVRAAPVAARSGVPAARIFFHLLDEALVRQQWGTANEMLREVRMAQPEPGWLPARDGELRLAEMRVARGRGERTRLFAAARVFANGDAARVRQMLDFAREVQAQGDTEEATALVAIVLQRSPEDRSARKLMTDWQPLLAAAR
ncbi:MAG: tetratricopeptide repeat protein [Verrucomicrobia bacterium]|nr:tetratricopeptide repeat protein [Verrucomicrobiota bacterium]